MPLRMLTARWAASCSAANSRSDSDPRAGACRRTPRRRCRSSGPPTSTAIRTACPVPCCSSCTAEHHVGDSSWMCAPTGLTLVADDCHDPLRVERLHRDQDVPDHASAADRVQHLLGLRLHAGAATGGQHDDRQVVQRHLAVSLGSSARARQCFGHCSPGRSRTYVASPDSKSGGPCRQTNRGLRPPKDLGDSLSRGSIQMPARYYPRTSLTRSSSRSAMRHQQLGDHVDELGDAPVELPRLLQLRPPRSQPGVHAKVGAPPAG